MVNYNRLRKDEILWLFNHKCSRHNRRYTVHPACYDWDKDHGFLPSETPIAEEKVGFLDIESSGLQADFGYILSYCIKEAKSKILERVLTTKEIRNSVFDKMLVKQLIGDIEKFDRLIVYWGNNYRFDIPFIRSRAIYWGWDFPAYKELYLTDCFNDVKGKLRLHNNRLGTACRFLDIPAKTYPLQPTIWMKALAGNKESLHYILKHNREDVVATEMLWDKLERYDRLSKTSI